MKSFPRYIPVLLVLGLLSWVPLAQATGYTFIDLPGVPDAAFTYPAGISSTGQMVGCYYDSQNVQRGFLRSSGGVYTPIEVPGNTFASGINTTGQISGAYIDSAGGEHGYLWSPGGDYISIDVSGASGTEANGINTSGQIVGYYRDSGDLQLEHGFLRSAAGVFTLLDVPGASSTHAFSINDAGLISGTYTDNDGGRHGFLRSAAGAYTPIDGPGASGTEAYGINTSGQIVGNYTKNGINHGFLLSGGDFTIIDGPGAFYTNIIGINDAGQLVGVYVDDTGYHGFLATPAPLPPHRPPARFRPAGIGWLAENQQGLTSLKFGDNPGRAAPALPFLCFTRLPEALGTVIVQQMFGSLTAAIRTLQGAVIWVCQGALGSGG